MTRDISVLVPSGVTAQELLDAMRAARTAIVQGVELFDFYQGSELGQGRKSLAFRVVMQDTERTLTDTEADAARDALVALLQSRFSASLRK